MSLHACLSKNWKKGRKILNGNKLQTVLFIPAPQQGVVLPDSSEGGGGGFALSVADHGSGDKWDRISWQTGFSPDDRKDQNC